jgi:hypothetical protein
MFACVSSLERRQKYELLAQMVVGLLPVTAMYINDGYCQHGLEARHSYRQVQSQSSWGRPNSHPARGTILCAASCMAASLVL